MVANLVAVLLSVPVLLLVMLSALATQALHSVLLIAALAICILPNPMAAGLQFLTWELAHGQAIFFSDQWDGLRRFGPVALRAWLVSIAGTGLIIANIVFYVRLSLPIAPLAQIIWLYVLVAWLTMHLYIYPLMMVQDDKRLWLIYRNAFVMSTSRPVVSVVLGMIWILVVLIGFGTGLSLIVAFALAASIQQNITAASLPAYLRPKT